MVRDYKEKGFFIGENDYEKRMEAEVIPFLSKISKAILWGMRIKISTITTP